MKIRSFVSSHQDIIPVEVEVQLLPGLPVIQFLGLPDQHVKESAVRIKSALIKQGFRWPRAQQILVDLKPSHFRKSSQGLDLAIALGVLFETRQLPEELKEKFEKLVGGKTLYAYAGLDLAGNLILPQNLNQLSIESGHLLSALGAAKQIKNSIELGELKDLASWSFNTLNDKLKATDEVAHSFIQDENGDWRDPLEQKIWREQFGNIFLSSNQAELLTLMAVSRAHFLLAGPPGMGKSFLASLLPAVMPYPLQAEEGLIRRWSVGAEILNGRPMQRPHHSASAVSIIGGMSPIRPGVMTKASGGVLILDELLEFTSEVQEALREPLLEGKIRLARGTEQCEFPARFQLVATSNLCPCGKWVPSGEVGCRFSPMRCRSYLDRLSGPFLDRFDGISFLQERALQKERQVPLGKVRFEVQSLSRLQVDSGGQQEMMAWEAAEVELLYPNLSPRRMKSFKKLCQALSLIKNRPAMSVEVLKLGAKYAVKPFLDLDKGMSV